MIHSVRFVPASFSNLADNLAEKINKNKCKDCLRAFGMNGRKFWNQLQELQMLSWTCKN